MNKTAAESHRILMEVYGEHALAEGRAKSGLHDLKMVILAWKIKRLKAGRYIQKRGNWVPHELKPRDVERGFCMSEMLLESHKKKSFLHRIVTGDEQWIH